MHRPIGGVNTVRPASLHGDSGGRQCMLLNGEYAMRQYDLPSLYRSTIGFDRLFSMLDQVSGDPQGYPPYNIERVGENAYRLTVAAAGFSADDLTIEVKENALTLRGEKKPAEGQP